MRNPVARAKHAFLGAEPVAADASAVVGSRMAALALRLVTVPLILAGLGLETYGIWAVSVAATGYLQTFAVSLGAGYIRELSVARGAGNPEGFTTLTSQALRNYVVGGLAAAVIALLLSDVFGRAVGDSPAGRADASLAMVGLGLRLVMLLPATALSWSAMAAGRLRASAGVELVANVAHAGALIGYSVVSDLDLVVVVAAEAGRALVLLAGQTAVTRPSLRRACSWRSTVDGATRRRLRTFAAWSQMSMVARIINLQLDVLLLGIFLGPAAAGLYDVAAKLTSTIRVLPLSLLDAVYPRLGAKQGDGDTDAVRELTARAQAGVISSTAIVGGIALGVSPLLFDVWVDISDPRVGVLAAGLILAQVLTNAGGALLSHLKARGMPQVEGRTVMVTALANVVATAALLPLFGMWGVLAGTVFANVAGLGVVLDYCVRHVATGVSELARSAVAAVVRLALPFVLVGGAVGAAGYLTGVNGYGPSSTAPFSKGIWFLSLVAYSAIGARLGWRRVAPLRQNGIAS